MSFKLKDEESLKVYSKNLDSDSDSTTSTNSVFMTTNQYWTAKGKSMEG